MTAINRRDLMTAIAALAAPTVAGAVAATSTGATGMYGLITRLQAVPGQRDALASLLLAAAQDMPGCLSYVVAQDAADEHALWVTEAWDSKASHQASLSLPGVQAAIARGKPLIAGFGQRTETRPLGGPGLAATPSDE